jgi:Family of unknown function (DUF6325)
MTIGPVEYLIVAFPGNQFQGDIAPELAKLVEGGTVNILDLVFIAKDGEGNTITLDYEDHEHLVPFGEIDGEIGGLISSDDIEHAAAQLDPDTSAALLIWEDAWAAPLAAAVRNSGGVIVEGARIPHEIIEAAFAEIEPA